ncbi:MAG: cysteine hydrolase [Burkholderiaceae bacterium]
MSGIVYLALHYQNENCHADGRIPFGMDKHAHAWRASMLAAARRMAESARRHGIPIIHVQLETEPDHADVIANCPIFGSFRERGAWPRGSWGARFIDGLEPQAGELVVPHGRNSAFYGSRLPEYMAWLKPDWLIISGVSTAYVVETTVRHAADIGYRLVVPHDACSTFRRDFHQASLRAMSLLARIAAVDEIDAALDSEDGLASLPFELCEAESF